MRVTPLIEKLEKEKLETTGDLNSYEEPTDSDSDDDDERVSPDAIKKRVDEFQRKFTRHEELLKNFTQAACHKLNRAMRLVQWKEAYDPNDPVNYGVIQEQLEPSFDLLEDAGFERKKISRGVDDDDG
ncbi:putative ribosomal protein S5 [Rosa chinensis]|uniref:Putative ribosomal protein S5 n=1 Tax=Rosa chinensis TaxID=74649 RepID=A0A2P6RE99_ROSCH|nr:putative ribosomal protein S5 [Rosa chinensis]